MQLKRVVVTGLGALTPIGNNIEEYWQGLISGKSGAAPITYYDTEKHKTKFACEVKNFNIEEYIDRKEARRLDKFAQYAIVASDEAIKDSNLDLEKINKYGTTVLLTTHNQEIVNKLQRRVVIIKDGRVVSDKAKGTYNLSSLES